MRYQFASCLLDKERRELMVDGAPVHVEPQVFDVLRHLIENRDRVVSRDELVDAVWHGRTVSDATVSARIFAARQAVRDTGGAQAIIRTVPRRGFRFVATLNHDETIQDRAPGLSEQHQVTAGAEHLGNRRSFNSAVGTKRWPLRIVVAPIVLFLLVAGGWWLAANTIAVDRGGAVPDRGRSIAVMSFDSLSNEEDQRFLAQGIAADIITELSRNADIIVLARSASFALSEKGMSAGEIARELDVRYILDGSVRRAGKELRISAQLIDSTTGNHVWADRYDATASVLYEMQDEIVEKIVGTLLSEVRETEKSAILRRPPSNLDVYELSLRGLARKHRLNEEDLRRGRQDLLQAIELDPEYAPAWLYLGWIESLAIAYEWIDGVHLSESIKKIEKAIELDPSLAAAYQALSIAKGFAGDAQGALLAARRSVELGPGDADNLVSFGRALATNGDFGEAVAKMRGAISLNPSRPSYYVYNLGRALWGIGEVHESSQLMLECLIKTPGFTACRVFHIANLIAMGEFDQATRAATALLNQSPDYSVEDALAIMGFAGDPEANEKLAGQLIQAGVPRDKIARAVH